MIKKPRISFSLARRTCSSQSGSFGQTVLLGVTRLLLEYAEQTVLAGFSVALAFCACSMALSSTAISCDRRPSESMAPLLIRDSSTRLFSSRRSTFSQNS